ncbi:tubulin polyglutamylase TTLL7 [Nematostella vectensis]|nr:tubulin polyglutamylase TTLL7 [Nematostella vectensis]
MPCSPRLDFTTHPQLDLSSTKEPESNTLTTVEESSNNRMSESEACSIEEHEDLVHERVEFRHEVQASTRKVSSKRKPIRKRRTVTANISATKYDIVRKACVHAGMVVTRDDDPSCFFIWSDSSVGAERFIELKPYQRINHFPGMGEICRKDSLARNIAKMKRAHPDEYSFAPQTWVLPAEYAAFQMYCRELKKKKRAKTFIMKPANGAMGNGISLIRNGDRIPSHEQLVIQEYIDRPFLLDGYKFDLRVYVLVTSCDPLRIFVYNDGLVRLGTECYEPPTEDNMDELFMHLTNYSINKHNENFERDENDDMGSKRSIKWLNEWLQSMDYDVNFLWRGITEVIVKTLIVAQPHVLHSYRMCRPGAATGSDSVCFELLGFDILLDRKLKPWLLEINRSPSFGTDSKLDQEVKGGALRDTLRLLNIKPSDRRRGMAAEKAESQRRLLTQPKRSEYTMSELDKKKMILNKRRNELKERLNQLRRESAREEFENINMGNFRRVYPPDDRAKNEKYTGLLADAFKLFLSGRAAALQKDGNQPFSTLREEEILDLLEQCEADENTAQPLGYRPLSKGPKPLSSMPSSKSPVTKDECLVSSASSGSSTVPLRQASTTGRPPSAQRSGPPARAPGQRIVTSSSSPPMKFNPVVDAAFLKAAVREREEELCRRTLQAFIDMRIKFPGKTDEEAEMILQNILENWKFHKPRVASYWLVKLDSIKRRKVIDIVRTNVRAILQRVWRSSDVDSLRLCRIISRVFNRLLWSHGQGLWNCFSNLGNSWETIFSKSTEVLSSTEMSCCRRVVQLCRDCLLIVYQFAADAKAAGAATGMTKDEAGANRQDYQRGPDLSSQHALSARMSRIPRTSQVRS